MADRRTLAVAVLAVAILLALGIIAVAGNPGLLPTGEYERTTVTVVDETGETLAAVTVRVADTKSKRYIGLSDTEALGPNEGMLFVHDTEDEYAYVMREMAFPIDIVFVDANGTITSIHHAELPPAETAGSALTRYTGRGKYVLEVPYNYTVDHDIEPGDRVRIAGSWGPTGDSTARLAPPIDGGRGSERPRALAPVGTV